MLGTVKFYDLKRHYGFIECLDETETVVLAEFLFHESACDGVVPGKHARVEFELGDRPGRSDQHPVAVNVRRASPYEPRAPIAEAFSKREADERREVQMYAG